jgi:hypothetical protein
MTQLTWDAVGTRQFETGVDKGVLFLSTGGGGVYDTGYAWNGLTTVTESPDGAEATPQYADNIIYLNLISAETFGGTIEAFTYPDQFAACDGTLVPSAGITVGQQTRKAFGLAYRTKVGNDTNPDAGYKIHLVYGANASPSEKAFATVNDSPEALSFSWDFVTTPVAVTTVIGGVTPKPTAILTIDSTKVTPANLTTLENALYGTAGSSPRLPLPDEVIAMFAGSVTTATPTQPTFVAAGGTITIPTITGVQYRRADTNAVVTGTVVIATPSTALIIYALPLAGYTFPPMTDTDWQFTRTT